MREDNSNQSNVNNEQETNIINAARNIVDGLDYSAKPEPKLDVIKQPSHPNPSRNIPNNSPVGLPQESAAKVFRAQDALPNDSALASTPAAFVAPTEQPANQYSPAPNHTFQPLPANKKQRFRLKNKLQLALICGLALIILLGASVSAYFGYYVPSKPDNVVKSSVANVFNESHYEAIKLKLDFDKKGQKVMIDTTAGTKNGVTRADFALRYAIFNIEGSAIYSQKDKISYVRVNGLDDIMNQFTGQPNSEKLANKWVKISGSGMTKINQADSTDNIMKCYEGLINYAKTEEFKNEVLKIYSVNEFASAQKVATESIENQKTGKYKIEIDQEKLAVFGQQLGGSKLINEKMKTVHPSCLPESTNVDEQSVKKSSLEVKNVYLWINDKKQIVQLKTDISDRDLTVTIQMNLLSENKLDYQIPTNVVEGLENFLNSPENSLRNLSDNI